MEKRNIFHPKLANFLEFCEQDYFSLLKPTNTGKELNAKP